MKDTFEYVNLILSVDEKLRGYPGYASLKKALAHELREIDVGFAPVPPSVPEAPVVTVFPADSGVIQKETEGTVQPSDRRI